MNFDIAEFMPALPEIFVLTMACIVLLVDVCLDQERRVITYVMSQATLVGAALLTVALHTGGRTVVFSGTFVSDPMGDVLKVFIYLVSAMALLYSRQYLIDRQLFKGEYFLLALFAVLGMMVLVSAHSLLTIYLGLELMSLSLYAMVAVDRDNEIATEAAMKYFVLGALASGMLLYGMSMIYGVTATLNLAEVASYNAGILGNEIVMIFGLAFVMVGLAFKLGAVPFHMWVPDVYHGAPTTVTLFIGTAPKIAAFAMLMRLLVEGLGGFYVQWHDMLVVLAVLSIVAGNVIAIAQTNIKRMLAYSTIAHVGFMLLGVLTGSEGGYAAAMFYIIVYALMAAGAFGMVVLLSRAGYEADRIEDFKGLNDRSPWYAFMMLILMLATAGVPPFLGFWAKLSVLQAVVEAGMLWLAVVAVLFSVVGAFYYLRIVKLMYFDKADDHTPITAGIDMRVTLSANGLAILGLGLFPGALMALCASALL